MPVKSHVKLDHKSGPVTITIEAATPEVAAYMANRLKDIFSGKKSVPVPESSTDALMRAMGLTP